MNTWSPQMVSKIENWRSRISTRHWYESVSEASFTRARIQWMNGLYKIYKWILYGLPFSFVWYSLTEGRGEKRREWILGVHHPREMRLITHTRSLDSLNTKTLTIQTVKWSWKHHFIDFLDFFSKSSTCWESYPLANPNPNPWMRPPWEK